MRRTLRPAGPARPSTYRRRACAAALAAAAALTAPAAAADIPTDATGCTLAEAIAAANADDAAGNGCVEGSGADVVLLGADVVLAAADPAATDTQGGRAGLPDVTADLTIRAAGGDTIEREASLGCALHDPTAFRLLNVQAGVALTLEGLTLRNGCIAAPQGFDGRGGAVVAQTGAAVTVVGGAFVGNRARGGAGPGGDGGYGLGGAIAVITGSDLTVEGTLFDDDHALGGRSDTTPGRGEGGAIYTNGGTLTLRGASFTGCTATGGRCTDPACSGGWAFGGAVRIAVAAAVEFRDSTFSGNRAFGGDSDGAGGTSSGGAVAADGADGVLERLLFVDNLALGGATPTAIGGGGRGGALYTGGSVGPAILDSAFTANSAQATGNAGAAGGGADLLSQTGELRGCSFVANRAEGLAADPAPNALGGALALVSAGAFTAIANSTFADNVAQGGDNTGAGAGGQGSGGAIYLSKDVLAISHVTAVDNRAVGGKGLGGGAGGTASGGGLAATLSSAASIDNSLLSGNVVQDGGILVAGFADCHDGGGPITSRGYNLVRGAATCSFAAPGDQTGFGAGIGLHPLADHGCAAPLPDGTCPATIALAAASPALDGGSCAVSGAATDQRGAPRPRDHAAAEPNADDGCDVGAFESSSGGFHALTPCRVLDTRADAPALSPGVVRNVPVVGACGVPASATAVALNVTVTAPGSGGHVTVYPGGSAVPATSTLNFSALQTRANNAIVPLAAGGDGSVDAHAVLAANGETVELILDVAGYFE